MMNPQTLLLEKSCLEISHRSSVMCHTVLSILACLVALGRCWLRVESPSQAFAPCLRAGYLSLQQAATRLLHLIVSSAHSRWEGLTSQDRTPRQWYTCSAAAGVAVLFFSALSEVLGVLEEEEQFKGNAEGKKTVTNYIFLITHRKNSTAILFMGSSYWPIFLSILQRRQQSIKYNDIIDWVFKTPAASHFKGENFSFYIYIQQLGCTPWLFSVWKLATAVLGQDMDKITRVSHNKSNSTVQTKLFDRNSSKLYSLVWMNDSTVYTPYSKPTQTYKTNQISGTQKCPRYISNNTTKFGDY